MPLELYAHQIDAIEKLRNGSLLCGGVGSGKSRTALTYYYTKVCGGKIQINGKGGHGPMKTYRPLYIITTAKKRDTLDWEHEYLPFRLSSDFDRVIVVDSWNNIKKYTDVKNSFFIFDEQRVVGSGMWVKSFLKIVKNNRWILLSATPGDTWSDYIPLFVANGFYKNRTEFVAKHVVFSRFTTYPKIDRYINCEDLLKYKSQVLVYMPHSRKAVPYERDFITEYPKQDTRRALVDRWNIFKNAPIRDAGELCYVLRKIANSDHSRLDTLSMLYSEHKKMIVFYNFDYELELLRNHCDQNHIPYGELNGHKHEALPSGDSWFYLVQYRAGAEAWNCIETNVIVLYSQTYSYKTLIQALGRIDRLNTPFSSLHYYHLRSDSPIDLAIKKSLRNKEDFNELRFMNC